MTLLKWAAALSLTALLFSDSTTVEAQANRVLDRVILGVPAPA